MRALLWMSALGLFFAGQPRDSRLVGTWHARMDQPDPYVRAVELQLRPDGTYEITGLLGESGTWRSQAVAVALKSETAPDATPYTLGPDGKTLAITTEGGRKLGFRWVKD